MQTDFLDKENIADLKQVLQYNLALIDAPAKDIQVVYQDIISLILTIVPETKISDARLNEFLGCISEICEIYAEALKCVFNKPYFIYNNETNVCQIMFNKEP